MWNHRNHKKSDCYRNNNEYAVPDWLFSITYGSEFASFAVPSQSVDRARPKMWGERQNSLSKQSMKHKICLYVGYAYKHIVQTCHVEILMFGLPECLCRSATAFRFFLCDLTRLELRLHGAGGWGRPGENRPSPLCDGVQDKEPERTQRSKEQALLSYSCSEDLRWKMCLREARL